MCGTPRIRPAAGRNTAPRSKRTPIEKALYYGAARRTAICFADDSGLEVDALGGAPGVHSARFAGPNATDADNNALLAANDLRGVENRTARFVCVIALVRDGKLVQTFRGAVEGRIIDEPRGSQAASATIRCFTTSHSAAPSAKPTTRQKMQVSHRAQALSAMFTFLRDICFHLR